VVRGGTRRSEGKRRFRTGEVREVEFKYRVVCLGGRRLVRKLDVDGGGLGWGGVGLDGGGTSAGRSRRDVVGRGVARRTAIRSHLSAPSFSRSGKMSLFIRRYFSSAAPSLSALKSSISRALVRAGKPYPEQLQQAQQFLRFNVYLKQEDGVEVSIPVYSASYSSPSEQRYVQVAYSSAASETQAEDRALTLELACGLAATPLACSAVVVGEAEDELTAEEKSAVLTQLAARLAQVHPEVSRFLYSPSLALRQEALAASSLSTLSVLSTSLVTKTFGISHFSSDYSSLIQGIDAEKGKVVSLTEPMGAMTNQSGLEIQPFLTHFRQHGTVKGFDGGETGRTLPRDQRKDILVLNHASGLREKAQIVAETGGFCAPVEWEKRAVAAGVVTVPGPLMDLGEVLCAHLTCLQAQETPNSAENHTEEVKLLLKSKEKPLKALFTAAIQSLSKQTLGRIQAKLESGQTLRDATLLKALAKH